MEEHTNRPTRIPVPERPPARGGKFASPSSANGPGRTTTGRGRGSSSSSSGPGQGQGQGPSK